MMHAAWGGHDEAEGVVRQPSRAQFVEQLRVGRRGRLGAER